MSVQALSAPGWTTAVWAHTPHVCGEGDSHGGDDENTCEGEDEADARARGEDEEHVRATRVETAGPVKTAAHLHHIWYVCGSGVLDSLAGSRCDAFWERNYQGFHPAVADIDLKS